VLISSLRVSVERYTRQLDWSWNYVAKAGPEDSMDLASVNCQLALAICTKTWIFRLMSRPPDDWRSLTL